MTFTDQELRDFADVTQETIRAYADVDAGELLNIGQAQCYKLRNLDFKASKWLPVPLGCLAMVTACGWYNEFNAVSLAHVSRLFQSGMMQIAREGSPCIYIKVGGTFSHVPVGDINPPMLEQIRTMIAADEVSMEEPGLLRVWFD